MVTACTIVARNYLAHARVLTASFLAHHPESEFVVLIIDDERREFDEKEERFTCIRLGEIGLSASEVALLAAIYDVTELATAVKPPLLRWLLASGRDHVIYLDPDIKIFAPLDEPARLAREHGIVLTPHTMVPMPDDGRGIGAADILAAGVYNLGFIAVGQASDVFLRWWWGETDRNAISDPENQMFTDQRSIDFVPALFPHSILKDPGYNVAYWNLHGRDLQASNEGYAVDGQPLRFFHFSGFDHRKPHLLSKHQGPNPRILLTDRPAVAQICGEYLGDLRAHGIFEKSTLGYGWGTFGRGHVLTKRLRRLYRDAVLRAERNDEPLPPGPFEGEGRQFLDWLNEPVASGPRPLVSRYLYRLHQERTDLRQHFPDLADADVLRYLEWVRTDGVVQDSIPEELVPDTRLIKLAGESAFVSPQSLTSGVNVVGYFRAELGVGEAGRQLTSAITAAGISCEQMVYEATESRQLHPFEDRAERGPRARHDINVLCVNADATPGLARDFGPGFFAGRHTAGLWFWEVETFPQTMHGAFDYVDEVWAATSFVAGAIAKVNRKPVYTVPVPVSIPACDRAITRASLGLPRGFLFLFTFDFFSVIERKNPIGLVQAFCRAFQPDEGPVLVIKSINGHRRVTDLERLKAAIGDRRDIVLIDRYYGPAEKTALAGLCDCYVSLHRSEGLGLTMAEAMGLEKPVIATAYSGNLDFMTPANSFLVDYTMGKVPEGTDPYPSGTPWADPNLDSAAGHMRLVFEHPDEAAVRARQAKSDIATKHSANAAGRAIAARLDAIRHERRGRPMASVPGFAGTAPRSPRESLDEAARLLTPGAGATGVTGRVRRQGQRMLLRLLRPYWWQQRTLQSHLLEAIAGFDQARAHEIAVRHRSVTEGLDRARDTVNDFAIRTVGIDLRTNELAQRLTASETALTDSAAVLQDQTVQLAGLSARLAALEARPGSGTAAAPSEGGTAADTVLQKQVDRLTSDVAGFHKNAAAHLAGLTDVVATLQADAQTMTARLRAVPFMQDPERFLGRDESGRQILAYSVAPGDTLPVYRGFEDVFRGSEVMIAERQSIYVPLLKDHAPVLDVGCGRGELLQLLTVSGVPARGVDNDAGMVERCRSKGLDAVLGDALSHLRELAPGSLGAIVAMQVIEHLPYEQLVEFMQLSHSRLRPGGRFVAETVNPHALEAFKTFWTDLTHKAPIFPEVALVLCWLHGFGEARVLFPQGTGELNSDRALCGEYAVVATR